jgi:hypothetical protein
MPYTVYGEAHGAYFHETGFPTLNAATDYASTIIDGDQDATVEVVRDADLVRDFDALAADFYGEAL